MLFLILRAENMEPEKRLRVLILTELNELQNWAYVTVDTETLKGVNNNYTMEDILRFDNGHYKFISYRNIY